MSLNAILAKLRLNVKLAEGCIRKWGQAVLVPPGAGSPLAIVQWKPAGSRLMETPAASGSPA
ncbi:MAG TPA: hypothetical protein VHO69_01900, partial [Phototrophicaceae bacterium]|nr:hypothetical protein [Phototrophicaceae bacterium]